MNVKRHYKQLVNIVLSNGLVYKVIMITWTNADLVYWHTNMHHEASMITGNADSAVFHLPTTFKNRTTDDDIELAISNEVMKPVSVVKLLGVTIDDKMSFDEHISRLCTTNKRIVQDC